MRFSVKSIISKKVMSIDAKEIGTLQNIYINNNGTIKYFSIIQKNKYKKRVMIIPFNLICTIKDYIIINKNKFD